MNLREQITVDVSKDEVLARADAILAAYGYARQPGLGCVLYTRGHRNKILYSFKPRSFGCEIEIWPVSEGDTTEVDLKFKLHNFGYYPLPQAVIEFLRDEFADIANYVSHAEAPSIDRADQERRSSRVFMWLMIAVVLLTYPPVIVLVPLVLKASLSTVLSMAVLIVVLGIMIAAGLPIRVAKKPLLNPILPAPGYKA